MSDGLIVSAGDKPLPKMRDWTKGSILKCGEQLALRFRQAGTDVGKGSFDD
jgi:hypothetical protein